MNIDKINCPICDKDCKSIISISKHIQYKHNLVSKDILFKYNKELFVNCKTCCVKIKYYITDKQARKFCSKNCYLISIKGKKQSIETVKKRILNTNQIKKEEKRQKTFITKYSSLYAPKDPILRSEKISSALINKLHTKEHHEKIIKSKRKNGTLYHTEDTKKRISETLKKIFNSESFDKSKFLQRKIQSYKYGYHKGFYCRSSYEKIFIDFCEIYKIKLLSSENNKFSVKYYTDELIQRTYFPDFYLPDLDIVVEIKPLSMYDYGNNISKYLAIMKVYRFIVITEEEHLLNKDRWDDLYNELLYV
jgi:endogenous inhibitor of DNA gyrase (YacG/DUF329 family)